MKSITIREWVTALRSGEYKQGKGSLCGNEWFCCLGVAADVGGALNDMGCLMVQFQDGQDSYREPGEFAGVAYDDLEKICPGIHGELIEMNDALVDGKHVNDFNAIADHIRENCDLDAVIRFEVE